MKVDLEQKFRLGNVFVLYDQATKKFKQLTLIEKHQFFKKLGLNYRKVSEKQEETLFTSYNDKTKEYSYREGRPVFILGSTSYTPDENFMILVNTLDILDNKIA